MAEKKLLGIQLGSMEILNEVIPGRFAWLYAGSKPPRREIVRRDRKLIQSVNPWLSYLLFVCIVSKSDMNLKVQ